VRSTIDITVAAPPELVFSLASDPLRWPALLPHYVSAREVGRHGNVVIADFVARRPLLPVLGIGLPVVWRSRTWAEPATLRIRFQHVAGATRGMDVTWRIEGDMTTTRVTIEHDFRPRIGVWAVVVDRFFTQPIAGRTLKSFKGIAEALASGNAAGGAIR
jgi:ribosome-associated toxin RatA of RatAB toxin-antitoxin module